MLEKVRKKMIYLREGAKLRTPYFCYFESLFVIPRKGSIRLNVSAIPLGELLHYSIDLIWVNCRIGFSLCFD